MKLPSHIEEILNGGTTAIGDGTRKRFFFFSGIVITFSDCADPMEGPKGSQRVQKVLTIKKFQIINTFDVLIPHLRAILFSYLCFISRENRQVTPTLEG